MRKIRQILTLTVLVWSFSSWANGQQPPDYLFLEVLDSEGKPVADATVESKGYYDPGNKNEFRNVQKTYENGRADFSLPNNNLDFANSVFRVSKNGYYPYRDLGFITSYPYYGQRATLELLKIPENKSARAAVGDEQTKREFMWSAKSGDAATIRRLLKAGISPNLNTSDLRGIPGPKNVPVVLLAAASGDAETIEALVRARANLRVTKEPGQSVLLYYLRADPFRYKKAESEAERAVVLKNFERGAEFLVKAGADFDGDSKERLAALMIAAYLGYTRVVKMFLGMGFTVNTTNEGGKTLLTAAADGDWEGKISKVKTIELLLEKGADPNEKCGSALWHASQRGDVSAMRVLLKAGARVNQPAGCGSALAVAISARKAGAAEILLEAGADINFVVMDDENLLMTAAKNGDAQTVQVLIDKGFPVNRKNRYGWTALHAAVNFFPNLDAIKVLLKAGADPDAIINYADSSGCFTPLIRSVQNRNYDLIKILVAHKANVDLACANGDTPLAHAVYAYENETVKLLVELGANPHGEPIDRALNSIKTRYKEDSYEGKRIGETIKIIEAARAQGKPEKSN